MSGGSTDSGTLLGGRNYPVGIPKLFGYYYQGEGGRGRSSILTKGCNLLLCSEYTGRDIVTCQLQMGTDEEAFVVSVYCDITINHVPLQLVQLLEDKNDCNILISMDANAHSPMWGSLDSNSRGDMIEELIFQHGLIICNKGSSPTFVGRGTGTIIDFTLCTSGMFKYISR